NRPSRFIYEIPRHLLHQVSGSAPKPAKAIKFGELQDVFSSFSDSGSGGHGSSDGLSYFRSSSSAPKPFAGGYSRKKSNIFENNPYITKGAGTSTGGKPEYDVGDTVSHIKFGEGTVLLVEPVGSDYEVTVDFEDFGKRKLKASFAKLEKI
ncbi:MAG: hypothetical protein IJL75_04945, partial [Eubacterium sp.]|nr:hypothetical protein [Eubacterium sp.]